MLIDIASFEGLSQGKKKMYSAVHIVWFPFYFSQWDPEYTMRGPIEN